MGGDYLTQRWHRWLRLRRLLAESTIQSYETSLARLERSAGVDRAELTIDHVVTYLRRSDIPFATRELTFVGFRSWHRWGATEGHWALDPEILEIRLRKPHPRTKPALTVTQARMLLNVADGPVECRALYLGLLQGLRLAAIGEVSESNWVEDGIVKITNKDGHPLELPIHPFVAAKRDLILSDQPHRRRIQRAVERLRVHVGVPMTPHWLRRTFAQRLRSMRAEPSVRAALMGHAPPTVTDEFYSPPTWNELVDTLQSLHYGGHE